MILKRFLYKLRVDLTGLMRYPSIAAGEGMALDYDQYWERRGGAKRGLTEWQKNRAEIAARFIERGSSVLDLGAGDGAMLFYWQERLGITPIGVDVSVESLSALEAAGIKAIRADVADVDAVRHLPEVDYITGFEILEHVPNPEALIYALKGKARKGMIFSFPNSGYYTHRLRLMLGRFPLQWIAHPGEHLRFWTARDVRDWVRAINLSLVKLVLYQGLPIANRVWPSLFAQGIIIVLRAPS